MVNLEKLYKGPALKSYAYEGKSVVKFASIGLFTDKEVSERLDNVLINKIETQFSLLKELRHELYANIDQSQVPINNENMKALLVQEDEKFYGIERHCVILLEIICKVIKIEVKTHI